MAISVVPHLSLSNARSVGPCPTSSAIEIDPSFPLLSPGTCWYEAGEVARGL